MGLHDLVKFDRTGIVDTTIGFGETIRTRRSGGTPRTIKAAVDRFTPQQVQGTPHAYAPFVVIHIRNDATYGMSDVDDGADQFEVARDFNGTAEWRSVAKSIRFNGGWTITLR